MALILRATPEQSYAQLSSQINVYAHLAGQSSIVSWNTVRPADSGAQFTLVLVTPKALYFERTDRANVVALVVIFVLIIPLVAILAAVLSWRLFARPTRALALDMDALTGDPALPASARQHYSHLQEISTMQRSYDSMASSIRSFAKFAPVSIVRRLLTNGNLEAQLGVEETEATCFFSDIVGFTSVSERVDPEVLSSLLQEYFNACTGIIEQTNGTVGNFIGDAIFAFWNEPSPVAQHALAACTAVIQQQEVLAALREHWRAQGKPELRARMGVNSGPCLAGNVGSSSRFQYTLIGDTVNLASRLEGLGKYYGVECIISLATWESPGVQESFCARTLDVVAVAGKVQPTRVFELMARRAEASAEQLGLERLSALMMEAFLAARFNVALELLAEMAQLLPPDDKALALMADKTRRWALRPALPQDWTGGSLMNTK